MIGGAHRQINRYMKPSNRYRNNNSDKSEHVGQHIRLSAVASISPLGGRARLAAAFRESATSQRQKTGCHYKHATRERHRMLRMQPTQCMSSPNLAVIALRKGYKLLSQGTRKSRSKSLISGQDLTVFLSIRPPLYVC